MFKERIRENYDGLTPGFRKLADFIMDSTLDVAFLTATELSKRVGVDPATVVRFAQELGYSGFRELSREIKRYVRDRVTASYRRVQQAGSTEEMLRGLVENARQNIEYFVTTDLASIVDAVEALRKANTIWCTGELSGYDVASFLAKKLSTQGFRAIAFEPSMASTGATLARMQEGDVLLTFAGSEPSIDAGYAVRLAREKGIKAVTLTGSGVALPARIADISVIVPYQSPAGVASFGPLLEVASLIYEALMTPATEDMTNQARELSAQMTKLLKLRADTAEYEVAGPPSILHDSVS